MHPCLSRPSLTVVAQCSTCMQIVLSILGEHGYQASSTLEGADVVLLNTCAIREQAEQRIWSRLGVLRHSFAQVQPLLSPCSRTLHVC